MPKGKCKKDNNTCNGKSLTCRLNPEKNSTYLEIQTGIERPFYNKNCSNYEEIKNAKS